jgi:hydroxyacylglutathione hydrolase
MMDSFKEENMPQEIRTINLGVNCYLVKTGDGYVLIDTGFSAKRVGLEKRLESAGCRAGNLNLIILTHGDSDHADNGAYLRDKYHAKIAMHAADAGMVERGDMSWNRKAQPDKVDIIFRLIGLLAPLFAQGHKFQTFQPDFTIDENFDLSEYGFDAKVLHLPGHSKGSIGILTAGGGPAAAGPALFCGDLLYNFFGKPGCPYIDDLAAFKASIEKLRTLEIKTVYPGHGQPFPLAQFLKQNR